MKLKNKEVKSKAEKIRLT